MTAWSTKSASATATGCAPTSRIVQVCDLVNLEVTMSVDEYDVKSLAVGQSCIVRVISLGIDFETTIAHINRVSASSGTLAYYTVACDLAVPEEVLPGMRATVIIPDQSVYGVNRLPLAALAFDEEENPYVLHPNTRTELTNGAWWKRGCPTACTWKSPAV